MSEVIIRAIRADELDELLDLYTYLQPNDAPLPSRPQVEALWQSITANPMLHYIGAECDQRLVASCNLSITPNLTRGTRPFGVIENVVTHPDYRRRGLGLTVLEEAFRLAEADNCYKVMLLSGSKEEGTLRFYEKAGFERGRKTGFVRYLMDV